LSLGGNDVADEEDEADEGDDDELVSAARKSASEIRPPVERAARRAIVFSSWRTLPGQSVLTRASISAGSSVIVPRPKRSP
jgi:hypothetical protein